MDPSLILVGFLAGMLIGVTSMGGAALMTPFLILILGVRPVVAVGTDLAYSAITKIAGAWMHQREGTVDLGMVRRMAAGSILGSLLGVLALHDLERRGLVVDDYIRQALGVLLVLVAAHLLYRALWGRWMPESTLNPLRKSAALWGGLVGFAVGATSVGSGSLIAPFLIVLYPGQPARAVGTDVFHAAILVSVAAAGHIVSGNVDWPLAGALLVGSLPGVLLGSYAAARIPAKPLRVGLGVVLLVSGLKLI